jgi:hypothetical protein
MNETFPGNLIEDIHKIVEDIHAGHISPEMITDSKPSSDARISSKLGINLA